MNKKSVGNCFVNGPYPINSSYDQFLLLGQRSSKDPRLSPMTVDADGFITLSIATVNDLHVSKTTASSFETSVCGYCSFPEFN